MINASRGIHRRRWTPGDIDTSLWIDIKDYSTLTFNVDHISGVADKSSKGNNLTQSSASAQPLYIVNGLNSQPCISFDGIDDYLIFDRITDVRSVAIVNLWTDRTGDYRPLLGDSSSYPFHGDSANGLLFNSNAYVAYNSEKYNNGTLWSGNPYFYKNTDASISTFVINSNVSLNTLSRDRTFNRYFYGKVSELIISNHAWSTDLVDKINGYVGHKWWNDAGMENTLPSNHKYKRMPPML